MKMLVSWFLGTLAAATLSATAQVWNPTEDFSVANGNPNGVWSYGHAQTDFSGFTLLVTPMSAAQYHAWRPPSGSEPAVWKNISSSVYSDNQPGDIALHPGSGNRPAILRWTAPAAGRFAAAGMFLPGAGGVMTVGVRTNNVSAWSASDKGTFFVPFECAVGDTVDFAVYGGYSSGTTGLRALIGTPVTVTLDAQGGVCAATETAVMPGFTYGALPVVTQANAFFAGWFTLPDGTGTRITAETLVPPDAVAHTLYAFLDTNLVTRTFPFVNEIEDASDVGRWTLAGASYANASPNGGHLAFSSNGAWAVTQPFAGTDLAVRVSAPYTQYLTLHASPDGMAYTNLGAFSNGTTSRWINLPFDGTNVLKFSVPANYSYAKLRSMEVIESRLTQFPYHNDISTAADYDTWTFGAVPSFYSSYGGYFSLGNNNGVILPRLATDERLGIRITASYGQYMDLYASATTFALGAFEKAGDFTGGNNADTKSAFLNIPDGARYVRLLASGSTVNLQELEIMRRATLTLDAGDGTCATNALDVYEGQDHSALPGASKAGYYFGGWWTEPDGQGTRITTDAPVASPPSDRTLYAFFTQDLDAVAITAFPYTNRIETAGDIADWTLANADLVTGTANGGYIRFAAAGSSAVMTPIGGKDRAIRITARYGNYIDLTVSVDGTNYTTLAAFTGGSAYNTVSAAVVLPDDVRFVKFVARSGTVNDVFLQAVEILPVVTVTWDTQGGAALYPAASRLAFGLAYGTLPTPQKRNHTFAGWFTAPDGGGSAVTSATLVFNPANHAIYAAWGAFPGIRTVMLDARGGATPSPATIQAADHTPYGILPISTRAGYTFGGWADASGEPVEPWHLQLAGADHTLYAIWLYDVPVTFNAHGGTPVPTNVIAMTERPYPLPATSPWIDGHWFEGWFTEPGGGGTRVTSATIVTNEAPHTLHAAHTAFPTLAEAFDAPGLTFTTGGLTGWTTSLDGGRNGGDALHNTNGQYQCDSQNSWISTTVTGPGLLSFYWKIDEGDAFRGLRFYVNDTVWAGLYPNIGRRWSKVSCYINVTGPVTLRWARTYYQYGISGSQPSVTYDDLSAHAKPPISASKPCLDELVWTPLADAPKVTVSYDFQGGDGTGYPAAVILTAGLTYSTPWPTRTGYSLHGWYTEPDGQGMRVTSSTTVENVEPHTLYAWWQPIVTVYFDSQGGSAPSPAYKETSGTYGTLPAVTRENHAFLGWYTASGGGGTLVTNASPLATTSEHTLYAAWREFSGSVPQTLPYALNATNIAWMTGGAGAWYPQDATTHDDVLAACSGATGHSAESWLSTTVTGPGLLTFWWRVSSEPNYDYLRFYMNGAQQASISGEQDWASRTVVITAAGDTEFKWAYTKDSSGIRGSDCGWLDQVIWQPAADPITITFDTQGGSAVTPAFTNLAFNAYYLLPTVAPVREGYTFNYWWTLPDGQGSRLYNNSTRVSTPTNHSVYAAWLLNAVVTFDAQNGTVSPACKTVIVTQAYSTLPTPVRSDHAFDAWYTLPGGQGTKVTSSSTVTLSAAHTLYANWIAGVPCTFDTQGGSPAAVTNLVFPTKNYSSFPTVSREGYTLNGWHPQPNGLGTRVTTSTLVTNTAPHTLYAYWRTRLTFSYDSQGGSVPTPLTVTAYAQDYYPSSLPTVTRPGYAFLGWFTEPDGGGTRVTSSTRIANPYDHALYACWRALPTLAEALDTPTIVWSTGGSHGGWIPSFDYSHDGIDCARGTPYGVAASQTNWLEAAVSGPGTISFWLNTQSYDKTLRLEAITASGATNLLSANLCDPRHITTFFHSFAVSADVVALRWTFIKTQSLSYTDYSVYLDEVTWTDAPAIVAVTFDAQGRGTTTTADLPFGQAFGDALPALTDPAYALVAWRTAPAPDGSPVTAGTILTNAAPFTLYAEWGLPLPHVLNATSLTWTTSPAYPWFGQTNETHDGISAARSAAIPDNGLSWVETVVSNTPVTLTYWCRVSSEFNYDFLRVTVNGTQAIGLMSGTSYDWMFCGIALTNAGNATVRWAYTKDSSYSNGLDCAFLDEVAVIPLVTVAVTLDPGSGTVFPSTLNLPFYTDYGALPIPARSDGAYAFTGWLAADGSPVTAATAITNPAPHTLTARWSKVMTATLDAQGVAVFPASTIVTNGFGYSIFPQPQRDGYNFRGWFTEPNGQGVQVWGGSIVTATDDHTLYVYWVPHYTVTFDAQGGGAAYTRDSLNPGEIYALPAVWRDGFIFGGWFTAPGGGGTQITSGTVLIQNADHTLYAHWLPGGITLAEALDAPSITFTTYGSCGWAATATAEAHDQTDCAILSNHTGTATLRADITGPGLLTFWWKAKITPDLYDNNTLALYVETPGATNRVTYTEDTADWERVSIVIPNGVTGIQWRFYVYEYYTAAPARRALIDQVTFTPANPVNTVTFDQQGGSVPVPFTQKNITYGDIYGQLPTTETPGIDFAGWYTAPHATGERINGSDQMIIPTNHTLYAAWRIPHTLTFDPQGETLAAAPTLTIYEGDPYPFLPSPTTAPEGLSFGGWYTQPGGAGSRVRTGAPLAVPGDHTLYAHYLDLSGVIGEAVEAPELFWTTGGEAPWFFQTDVSYDNEDAIRAGAIPDNGTSWVQADVTGPGIITFRWSFESQLNRDYVYFYTVDASGNLSAKAGYSGAIGIGGNFWQNHSFTINPGIAALRWTYKKDDSGSGGEDTAWLDTVTWTPIPFDVTNTVTFVDHLNRTVETRAAAYGTPYGELPELTLPPVPVAVFGGWFTSTAGQGRQILPETRMLSTYDHTLYPKWLIPVTFAAHSATIPSPPSAVLTLGTPFGGELPRLPDTPSEIFGGWWTSPSGGGSRVLSRTSVATDHVSLHAHWQPAGPTLADAVDAPAITFSTDGDAPWVVASDDTFLGDYSARSGSIADAQVSRLTAQVTGPGIATFRYRTSTRDNGDRLLVIANGVTNGYDYGLGDWYTWSLSISVTGSTDIVFVYSKDAASSGNADAVWIDAFSFTPVPATTDVMLDPLGGSVSPATVAVPFGAPYNAWLPVPTPPTPSASFFGWSWPDSWIWTYIDGEIVLVPDLVSGTAMLQTNAHTLVAAWRVATAFNLNGAPGTPPPPVTGFIGSTFGTLLTPVSGAPFEGWYTDAACTEPQVISGVTTVTLAHAGATLYAKWGEPFPPLSDTSLAEAVDAPSATFFTGGDRNWTVVNNAHIGSDCARSGDIDHGGASHLSTTVTGPGTVSFWWKVSSEGSYDFLSVAVNGAAPLYRISGTDSDWAFVRFPVTNATVEIVWRYSKDGSFDRGEDCGWLDGFTFTPYTGDGITVTFDTCAPNVPAPAPLVLPFGAAYGQLPVLTRPGHIFGGWYTDSPLGASPVIADHTLHARWAAVNTPMGAWTLGTSAENTPLLIHTTIGGLTLNCTTNAAKEITVRGFASRPDGLAFLPLADPVPTGYTITAISDRAFAAAPIAAVTLPATLASAGNRAFYNCPSLESIAFTGLPPAITPYAANTSRNYGFTGNDFNLEFATTTYGLYTEQIARTHYLNGVFTSDTVTVTGSPRAVTYILPIHAAAWSAVLESGTFAGGDAMWQNRPIRILGDTPPVNNGFLFWLTQYYDAPLPGRDSLGANGIILWDCDVAGLVPADAGSHFLATVI